MEYKDYTTYTDYKGRTVTMRYIVEQAEESTGWRGGNMLQSIEIEINGITKDITRFSKNIWEWCEDRIRFHEN